MQPSFDLSEPAVVPNIHPGQSGVLMHGPSKHHPAGVDSVENP